MKAYWNRREPFFVVLDNTDSEGFDAYPVEISDVTVRFTQDVKNLLRDMGELFDRMPAPEEGAVREAAEFDERVKRLLETY